MLESKLARLPYLSLGFCNFFSKLTLRFVKIVPGRSMAFPRSTADIIRIFAKFYGFGFGMVKNFRVLVLQNTSPKINIRYFVLLIK